MWGKKEQNECKEGESGELRVLRGEVPLGDPGQLAPPEVINFLLGRKAEGMDMW